MAKLCFTDPPIKDLQKLKLKHRYASRYKYLFLLSLSCNFAFIMTYAVPYIKLKFHGSG